MSNESKSNPLSHDAHVQAQRPAVLPIRIAHPSRPGLDHIDDVYFALLKRCGYTALYLDNSPFDHETGSVAQFFKDFHLISLYDIACSFERARMQDYINQVCVRAQSHGIKVYLQCHEPRLPYYAWSSTPPHWRGHGGWPHNGSDAIAFCWSVPDAVAYWKQMAHDAFAAVPLIAGVTASFMDNEAVPCDQRCPRCRGERALQMMADVLETYHAIGQTRGDFFLGIVDWWLDQDALAQLRAITGPEAYIIGHSCKGLPQVIDGTPVPGAVGDMAMLSGRCSEAFLKRKRFFTEHGFRVIDRTVWSHAIENWFLPAPPDPVYAIEKLNALAEAGVEGWFDFDCGALEPGSIAEAIAVWTRNPQADPEDVYREVLVGIFGEQWQAAKPAYDQYRTAKQYFPIAYDDPEAANFSARALALTIALVGPFFLEDFAYFDTRHAFNYFAPFNLVTQSSVAYLTAWVEKTAELAGLAFAQIQHIEVTTSAMQRECDAFEIHYRQYRAIAAYLKLAQAKLAWLKHEADDELFVQRVRAIAQNELANMDALDAWVARNPGKLDNPNHDLLGKLEEIWPGIDFAHDMLRPKRRSLELLVRYTVQPPLPLTRRL